MRLSRREERLLTRTGDTLARSDPRLASMLAAFRQLAEGEQMPGREQLHSPVSRALAALAAVAAAIGAVITAGAAACGRWLGCAVAAWGAAISGLAVPPPSAKTAALPAPSAAGSDARPDHPDLSRP